MSPSSPQTAILPEFRRLFVYLNRELFEGRLNTPTFRFDPRKRLAFRFKPNWFEIVVGSKLGMNSKPDDPDPQPMSWKEILLQFTHEMIHVSNFEDEIADCTTNQYHNQDFAKTAKSIGFYVVKHQTRGWHSIRTEMPFSDEEFQAPRPDRVRRLKETFSRAQFDLTLLREAQDEIMETKLAFTKQFQLKYICNCAPPHNTIRSGRRPDGRCPLQARCEICGYPFVYSKDSTREYSEVS